MQAQLNTLSQAGAWGNMGKPQQDMAFLLIAPSITTGYKRVLALWQYGHIPTKPLEVAVCKLALLVDESADQVYTFVWLNEGLSHVPLSSEVHMSAMTDGTPSTDAHGQLHQLQICKLLQHKDMVVCLEGLNGELEALLFTFQELPLWDATSPGEPTCKPQLIEGDLSSVQPESRTTAIQTCTTTLMLPPLWLIPESLLVTSLQPSTCSSRGPWSGCSRLPLQPQVPVSQHSMPRRELPSVALDAQSLSQRKRKSPWARGGTLHHPCIDSNPHTDISAGNHTRWYPQLHSHYSPTAPANHAKDTRGGKHLLCLTASGLPGLDQPDCQMSYFSYRRK